MSTGFSFRVYVDQLSRSADQTWAPGAYSCVRGQLHTDGEASLLLLPELCHVSPCGTAAGWALCHKVSHPPAASLDLWQGSLRGRLGRGMKSLLRPAGQDKSGGQPRSREVGPTSWWEKLWSLLTDTRRGEIWEHFFVMRPSQFWTSLSDHYLACKPQVVGLFSPSREWKWAYF